MNPNHRKVVMALPNENARDRLSDKEAADYIGVSIATVRSWRFKRIGPPYLKIIRRIYYRRSDLNEWIDKCAIHPEAQ